MPALRRVLRGDGRRPRIRNVQWETSRAAAPPNRGQARRGKPTALSCRTGQAEGKPDWGWLGRMLRGIHGSAARERKCQAVAPAPPAIAQDASLWEQAWP